jgi:hypothetical protein
MLCQIVAVRADPVILGQANLVKPIPGKFIFSRLRVDQGL